MQQEMIWFISRYHSKNRPSGIRKYYFTQLDLQPAEIKSIWHIFYIFWGIHKNIPPKMEA